METAYALDVGRMLTMTVQKRENVFIGVTGYWTVLDAARLSMFGSGNRREKDAAAGVAMDVDGQD